MKLDLFRTLWGVTAPLESLADTLRAVGFNGVEARIAETQAERRAFRQALDNTGLEYIAILFTGGDVTPNQSESSADHLARMDRLLAAASADLSPRFFNVLAGNDRWPISEQVAFFGQALELAQQHGVLCSFETHRATSLYSPWPTLELIRQLPELRFTADISHWVLVCERLLDQPADDLSPFLERVHHVQARVGYAQGAPDAPPRRAGICRGVEVPPGDLGSGLAAPPSLGVQPHNDNHRVWSRWLSASPALYQCTCS